MNLHKIRSIKICKKTVFQTLNLPRHILNMMIGKNHPLLFRLALGFLIMLLSTLLPEEYRIEKAVAELIHAFGAIPVLEFMIEVIKEDERETLEELQTNS